MTHSERETKWTAGPWEPQMGQSDWGMPCAHIIVKEGDVGNNADEWIAEIPSRTPYPYCVGASIKDKEFAQRRAADAYLISAAPELYAALVEAIDELEAYEVDASGELYNNPRFNAILAKARGES